MSHRSKFTGAAILTGAFLTAAAHAQSINYGEFQELFGEPVTTSATGSPQKASEAPANIQIISAVDIKRSGADNVPDILRFVAGVDVRRYGFSDADIGIRGYTTSNSPRVLVLVNGRQVYVDYHSYTAWQTLPVQIGEIRQIEIVRGPSCALFGFNAVSGVINIVTFDPLYDQVNEATARLGTQDYANGSLVSTAHIGESAGLRLSAGGWRATEQPASTQTPLYGPYTATNYNHTISADSRWKITRDIELKAELTDAESKEFELTAGGYPGTTHYHVNSQKLGLGAQTGFGFVNVTAYRNDDSFVYYPGGDYPTYNQVDNILYVVQANDLFHIGASHSFRVGLEYRNDTAFGSYFLNEHLGFELYSASIMWNWAISPEWSLTNSLRLDYLTVSYLGSVPVGNRYTPLDYNSPTFTEPSFNSTLLHKPSADDTIRLSVARGVQPPDLYELFPEPGAPAGSSFVAGTGSAFEGNPRLSPTVVMNYEVDYDRTLQEIGSTLRSSIFYQESTNLLAPPGDAGPADPATGYLYAGNIGRSEVIGGEISLKGSSETGWRWGASYALAAVTDHLTVTRTATAQNTSLDFQHGSPTSAIILSGGKSWGDFDLDLQGKWQSRYQDVAIGLNASSLPTTYIGDYYALIEHLAYRATDQVTIGLTGEQLSRAYTTAGIGSDARFFATASFSF